MKRNDVALLRQLTKMKHNLLRLYGAVICQHLQPNLFRRSTVTCPIRPSPNRQQSYHPTPSREGYSGNNPVFSSVLQIFVPRIIAKASAWWHNRRRSPVMYATVPIIHSDLSGCLCISIWLKPIPQILNIFYSGVFQRKEGERFR